LAILPARFDPNFPDHLEVQRITDLRNLRALPVPIGSMICFNLALMHWGTRNVTDQPRVSFAFELARADQPVESPNVDLRAPLGFVARAGFLGRMVELLGAERVPFSEHDHAQAATLRALSRERGSRDDAPTR
jgi:ectoine hydroxylase-related dioxygenase (phytanoyl-CoA dioxygenase family)